jgi:hypothetical protein
LKSTDVIGNALDDGREATERIARPVHHREADDRAGQIRRAHHRALDGDLVVLLVEPPEHLLEHLHLRRRIRLKPRAQRG